MLTITMALLAAQAAAPIPARCRPGDGRAGYRVLPKGGSSKLGDQPPAARLYALYRLGKDGCPDPIVLERAIGANPERQLEVTPVPPRVQKVR